jgi:hypothetical protein
VLLLYMLNFSFSLCKRDNTLLYGIITLAKDQKT